MPDRKKVINALGRCESYGYCEDKRCPYYKDTSCLESMRKDALELLKEQEAVKPMNGLLCGQCGCIIYQDANYCYNCGRKVKRDD